MDASFGNSSSKDCHKKNVLSVGLSAKFQRFFEEKKLCYLSYKT